MPKPHYLDPLLRPQSLAIVGASRREGTVGNLVLKNLITGGYQGELFAVNPGYEEVEGIPCFASLSDLPAQVEHVCFAVSDSRIENALDEAIQHGARAGTMFSLLVDNEDNDPPLRDRIKHKVSQAGMLLCGANSMGFYTFNENTWACGFDTRLHKKPGNVSLISQSGSGMCGIVDVDERINFNFVVSTGQELLVSMEDYLDFALEQDDTRVIGLFMETSRHPEKFIAALEKAARYEIPIVAVKVGRTQQAAELAVSHSGALAGSDAAYDAVFERYGVLRVNDMDELATALIMFAQPYSAQTGGVVSIHDSGGEQQLMVDLADKLDVALADLSEDTRSKLAPLLDAGLVPVNPLDAWGTGGESNHERLGDCFGVLLKDENAALGALVHDRAPFGEIYQGYYNYLCKGREAAQKPIFLVANRQGTGSDENVVAFTQKGFPVIDGVSGFLAGAKCMLKFRDFINKTPMIAPLLDESVIKKWRPILADKTIVDEHEAGLFLKEFNIPIANSWLITNEEQLVELEPQLTYPLAMKTANAEIQHKSDVDGIRLDLRDKSELMFAYKELSSRLGESVLVSHMNIDYGVEMILGISQDEQFGSLIIMGMGGVNAEVLNDTVVAVPPFDAESAYLMLDRLKMRKLLDTHRGKPALDVMEFCQAAACLSAIAVEFKNEIMEVDINPIKVMEQGCSGLDALIVVKQDSAETPEHLQARRKG